MSKDHPTGPRVCAFVGPYTSGKTTLLESILAQTGAVPRKGRVKDGSTVGDSSPEARARQMTTDMNVAHTTYLDDHWTFLDCPGSVELSQEALGAVMVADVCVVVCEPDVDRAVAVQPLLRLLDEYGVPHIVFVNKMDTTEAHVKSTLEALQSVSGRPLVLREIPIRDGDTVTGHVDLVSERAFEWQPGQPSNLISLPDTVSEREAEARTELLESLADFDDSLLEQLLEDVQPSAETVYDSLAKDLADNLIVPVFFGSAENDNGVTRLLKALRHEAPGAAATAERLGIEPAGDGPVARVFKTLHAGHAGKLSLARLFHGRLTEGAHMGGARPSGLFRMMGQNHDKTAAAEPGDVVALGRLDDVATGDLLTADGTAERGLWPDTPSPLYALALETDHHADEVKLAQALAKVLDEDPSLSAGPDPETGSYVMRGQGEVHLKIACDKLANRAGLTVRTAPPEIPYKETIRKPVTKHARHKKQSGGHGEFGDVHIDIKPLGRGEGFAFTDTIHGGAVPKQYIPAVEAGVKEYLARGPLGFPVVDVAVTLTDGQFHSVDSSDMAFKKAAAQAMREAMPDASPVLLEPIHAVAIFVPNDHTAKIQRIITGRRGQIMGFDARDGWDGWDRIDCHMPLAEMADLIVELRSATHGVGTFEHAFDHLQELSGREADQVVANRRDAA
jgi:elongation factor G